MTTLTAQWLADRGFVKSIHGVWSRDTVSIGRRGSSWQATVRVDDLLSIPGLLRDDPAAALASLRDAVCEWLDVLRAADLALECIEKEGM